MGTGRNCTDADTTLLTLLAENVGTGAVTVCDLLTPEIQYQRYALYDADTDTFTFYYFDSTGLLVDPAPTTVQCECCPQDTVSPLTYPALYDAFGRSRVSEPYTLFDSKQLYDNLPLIYDDAQTSGAGTSSTHSVNLAATTLAVGNLTAGTRVRQTKQRFNYQPGKSQLIMATGVIGSPAVGITRRIGYFDQSNGIYWESGPTNLALTIRSFTSGAAVDNRIAQTNWNIDRLDGTGASGLTLNPALTQILYIDLEWLGVGRVRVGFVIDGAIYYAHEFQHANSLAVVYMSTPNLPIRYEISNGGTGGVASLVHICSTVISEGGLNANGIVRSVDRGVTPYVTGNNTNIHPLLSFRLKTTHLSLTVVQLAINLLCTSTNNYRWSLILNPTVAGVDNAVWVSLTNSGIEYDVSRTNANTLTGGTVLASGYASSKTDVASADLVTALVLGSTIAGVRDQLVVAVQNISAGTEDVFAAVTFRELV